MSKKQIFAKVGAIVGIVGSAFLIFTGIIMVLGSGMINYDFVIQVLAEQGTLSQFVSEEIDMIVTIAKAIYILIGLYMTGMAVAGLVLSIKVLKQSNKNTLKKGCVIALLIISVLTANIVTAGFMITTLCLRNKNTSDPAPAGMTHVE